MKRINPAFPIESLQGSFGAKQDLRYAENNNKAFQSPDGKVNYAKNYKPQLVASRVSRTGLNYFSVKTKSATKNTAAWRMVAALMGAVSAIYGWCIKQLDKMSQLSAQYAEAVKGGYDGTLRKFIIDGVRASLAAKAATITVVGPSATVTLGNNPFSTAAEAITIPAKILVKFWVQLAPNGITFDIAGRVGLTFSSLELIDVISVERLNVLGITTEGVYCKIGDQYIIDTDGAYLTSAREIVEDEKFTLTNVAPEP